MSTTPLKAYVLSNGSTGSTRILDIDFTCNGVPIANLRSVFVEAKLRTPHAFSLNLTYNVFETNRIVPRENVFNTLTDSMDLAITTSTWDVQIDYNITTVGNELTLKYGGSSGTTLDAVSNMIIEFNQETLHPGLTLDFYLI